MHALGLPTRSSLRSSLKGFTFPRLLLAMALLAIFAARPLIPAHGLPMFPAVLLWFPESNNMSDVQVVGVQPESSASDPSSYRWLKIGILILFGMGLLGMLFS